MRVMRTALVLSAMILLAACSNSPDSAPARPTTVAPPSPPRPVAPPATPAPAESISWDYAPATPGDWAYRRDTRGSIALFGPVGAGALFAIRCDTSLRRIYLTRAWQLAAGDSAMMTVRASNGLQSFPVSNTGGGAPLVGAELDPANPHLDAMAYSRGKFAVSINGATDLIVPSWPEFGRVVQDCRS